MPKFPTFSVVIPTCDREDDLRRCLDRLGQGAQVGAVLEWNVEACPGAAVCYEVVVTNDLDDFPRLRAEYPWIRMVPGPQQVPRAGIS